MKRFFKEYALTLLVLVASFVGLFLFNEIKSELKVILKGVLYLR